MITIILDSLRWDHGDELNIFEGVLTQVDTGVVCTRDWYLKNYSKPTNTHLISENPMPWHTSTNHAYKNFKTATISFGKTWLEINPAETLKKWAELENGENWLIHLIPPHAPFIYGQTPDFGELKPISIYETMQAWANNGHWPELRKLYRKQVASVAQTILEHLHLFVDHELIITADHGESLGLNNVYGHPPDAKGELKNLLTKAPHFKVDVQETLLAQRLKALGYIST